MQVSIELKSDGTGAVEMPFLQKLVLGPTRPSLKWSIEGITTPILVLDTTDSFKNTPELGQFPIAGLGARNHFYYKLDGDTLTLTPLTPGRPQIVWRRVKANPVSAKVKTVDSKNATNKADKKSGPGNPTQKSDGSLELDPNDLEQTQKWALAASRERLDIISNQIALADHAKKFNNDSRRYVGKEVSWSMQVSFISETNVNIVQPNSMQLRRESSNPWEPFSLIVGGQITRQRAAQLQQNSIVQVKGTIREVKMADFGVSIVIGEVKAN
ncbi:MAG TPA: hypothetical protein VFE62_08975 [Gemmataceae bacterium]|nr:hypothetical protein [Gemmataceae bacterium]